MKGLYVVLGIVLALVLLGGCSYNGMNASRINVNEKWGNVQTAYQRRADLIPNLVETVKGEANFEKGTLVEVMQARASATQMKIDPNELTPEKMKQFQQTQGQLSQALGRLLVVSEQYPQLRANESFRSLQNQLEGTENRINISRNDFNASVKDYNTKVTSFPGNIMANMFGFKEKAMFEAEAGAEHAPKVKF